MTLHTSDRFDLDAAPAHVSHVTLIVRDLDRMTRFYQDIIGLKVLSDTGSRVTLGAATPFLSLCENTSARLADPRDPGLFHTAFLLPDRQSLASWLAHASDAGVMPDGAADHNVSEAIYLDDPEGNGLEIYVDRPVSFWAGADGAIYMPSDRLDLTSLPEPSAWTGAPEATRIGHIHLRTTAIAEAERFWTRHGFNVTARYLGGSFFGMGGYHHQIATNIWHSAGRPAPQGPVTGLKSLNLTSTHPAPASDMSPSGAQINFIPKGI